MASGSARARARARASGSRMAGAGAGGGGRQGETGGPPLTWVNHFKWLTQFG
jgi:hypothetical protein